ncbi:PQ loop repeat-domain-containing protein [Hyaloraphidium curvatum]|nr:PQ loop repeat-domain-containing protein [Hyaloraphidium curvatum]
MALRWGPSRAPPAARPHAAAGNASTCVCEPEFVDGHRFNQWIGSFFGDCVYSPQDYASWAFGMLSLLIWIIVFIPQLHLNFKRKSVEGLSFGLLTLWTFGDIANLVGTYLANQLPPQRATAIYFLITDALILLQWLYYNNFMPLFAEEDKPAGTLVSEPPTPTVPPEGQVGSITYIAADESTPLLADGARTRNGSEDSATPSAGPGDRPRRTSSTSSRKRSLTGNVLGYNTPALSGASLAIVACVALCLPLGVPGADGSPVTLGGALLEAAARTFAPPPLCNAQQPTSELARVLGYVCAWTSGLFYMFSRFPQILENAALQSVEGLSIPMFFLTVSGNLAYGLGILLRLPAVNGEFWLSTFPYIMGSMGTIVFDIYILYQAWTFGQAAAEREKKPEVAGFD